jgi:hypothetical protein
MARYLFAYLLTALMLISIETFSREMVSVNGVFPQLTVYADGIGSNSETGIGAMIPWANKLWAIGYVAHIQGQGIGLYEMNDDMTMVKRPESVTGTFANRLVHWDSNQAIIGPHIIDAQGKVRTFKELSKHRLTATARHLKDPNMVYFLTMEGKLFEANVQTLKSTFLFDLNKELKIPKDAQPHYKGCFSSQGRLVVANNTYEEQEHLGSRHAGRLAEWNGKDSWTIIEENPFIEVSGKQNPAIGSRYGNTLFAMGYDQASVIFRVLHNGQWKKYRLPFGSQSWCHTWNTEWMRIREVQTERYLMDAMGIFYDLPALVYGDHVMPIRPVCTHLRICPDLVSWRGMLVLAGDQTDNAVGQPQSGFWFGHVDELWKWGKPSGWGAVWRETAIQADEYSDSFLMTGFDKKIVHLSHHNKGDVLFSIEVDVLGNGCWQKYTTVSVPASTGYAYHIFPEGFSAHWLRLKASQSCTATAQLIYN